MFIASFMTLGATGVPGYPTSLLVDTNFYKGNYPESCLVEGCFCPNETLDGLTSSSSSKWTVLLPRTRLSANAMHTFQVGSGLTQATCDARETDNVSRWRSHETAGDGED